MISSRTLLLSLIALNLLALAWWSGAMSPLSDSIKEPQRLEGQIEPQRLKLVGANQTIENPINATDTVNTSSGTFDGPSTSNQSTRPQTEQESIGVLAVPFADKEAPPSSIALYPVSSVDSAFKVPASLDEAPVAAPDVTAVDQWQIKPALNPSTGLPMVAAAISGESKPTIGTNANACLRYTGMSYIEAREVEDDLLPIGAAVELERADTGSYLVYIDPLPTEQLASRKRTQLRSIGVTDLQVIRSGYYRNGISLGLLRSLPLAKKHQTDLAALGVSSMRIGPVNVASARYDLVVNTQRPEVAQKVRNHEVLSAMTAGECDR